VDGHADHPEHVHFDGPLSLMTFEGAILAPVRPVPAILLTAASLLAAPRPAGANMAKAVLEGERYGALVPEGATSVRVDRETLSFTLAPALDSAAVTAAYQLTNGGAADEAADVAFAFVRGERGDGDPAASATVEADGAPLPFRSITDAGLLEPKLRAWLEAHPEVERELGAQGHEGEDAGSAGTTADRLRALVADAGGKCRSDCRGLLAWHRSVGDDEPRFSPDLEDEALLHAAREAVPAAAAELTARWSALAGNREDVRLGFLLFHLDLKPGQTRSVTVHYVHRPDADRSARVNPTYGFDYLLSPARRWAGFGPLDVSVQVPPNTRFASRTAFRRKGDTYRAELPGLPDGELRFEAMSLDGLWLGMTQPRGYWAILAFAIASTALAVGVTAGRFWARASRLRRLLLLPLLAAGPLSVACALAVLVLLLIAFPSEALGFGYEGILRGALLVLLAAPVGALASVAAAAWKARRIPAAPLASK
jgi:hypothetical protein